jgi:hypothetical protein
MTVGCAVRTEAEGNIIKFRGAHGAPYDRSIQLSVNL